MPKTYKCKICKQPYIKRNSTQQVCSVECAIKLSAEQSRKKREKLAKAERAETRKRMTALEALNRFGCMRLSARILDLREQGYPITDEMMKDPNSGKRYKAYWLAEGV